ncbi:MAG: YdcF family protein [Oscillospiraceae bacterium]|nr:YdcF family protein [Oscillospiraceae bacterium]
MHRMEHWMITCAVLTALAAFFKLCLRGYTYISVSLLFIMFLLMVFHLGSDWLKRIVAVVTCIGLMYFCVVEYLVVSNAKTDADPQRSYLIVLGAAVHGDMPSLSLYHRLSSALDYLNTYPESKAVLSGGQGKGENLSEALCMHDWLVSSGIEEERLILEDRSTSTMENLQFSWEKLQELGCAPDDVAILSSNYHLYRAKTMARSLGMDPVGVCGVMGYPIYTLGMFIREAFGLTHLWVFGN